MTVCASQVREDLRKHCLDVLCEQTDLGQEALGLREEAEMLTEQWKKVRSKDLWRPRQLPQASH